MTTLWFDSETYCEVPIKNGTHAYAEAVEVMVAAWAVDDGEVIVEDLTVPKPDGSTSCVMPSQALLNHLTDPSVEVVMHKSDFDRTVVRHAWGVEIAVERVHDTMVQALAHGLPGGLDRLCEVFKVDAADAKDKEGKGLIQLFCKPLPKNSKARRANRLTHPAKWKQFLAYAGSDIRAMRVLRRKLPSWNYSREHNQHPHGRREYDLWRLDQAINDRGFAVDLKLANTAIVTVKREQTRLKAWTKEETDGALQSTTQRDELLKYILAEYGVDLPDMKKDTLERRIEDPELPDALRQLLRVRLSQTAASTAKFAAILRAVSEDGRLRGSLQFAGAKRTARWAGRLFQPQNLPRPTLKHHAVERLIEACCADALDLVHDDPIKALTETLRGLIVAAPGMRIVAADLSQIESRVGPWLAGEQWKLDAFQEIDTALAQGLKPADIYCRAYATSFGVTPEEVMANAAAGGFWRQVGKVQELALLYEGGVGAFLAFAAVYRLDLDKIARGARIPDAARRKAEGMLEWTRRKGRTTYGLPDHVFIACEAIKALWREAHPEVKGYWPKLAEAAREAIARPGRVRTAGRLAFERRGAWLRMELPSGRVLCYANPSVKPDGTIQYMGENQYSRKWAKLSTYGGKLLENATQAAARDVIADAMPEIEDAGYRIVLTVHDEIIAEAGQDRPELTAARLSSILATNPPWLPGCPLSAAGFEAQRYRKD